MKALEHQDLLIAVWTDPTTGFYSAVAWDEFGAGRNSRVAISEGGEAAQPFRPELKPVDTYCAAILDALSIDRSSL